MQFVGTLFFNARTFQALQHEPERRPRPNRQVWTPDVLGSIAFLVASAIACVDVRRPGRGRRHGAADWWVGVAEHGGSIAFGVSAAASYVIVDSDTLRNAQRANLGTFVGALCFLVGAVLILPSQSSIT